MKRLLLAATLAFASPVAAFADTPQHLVDSATLALEDLMSGAGAEQSSYFLHHAKAVVLCPNIFRGAFMLGGEGGGCVLVARNQDGGWSSPAFYTMGSASFGFQIGVQSAEVMMLVMTDGGVNALLNSQLKIGADAGISVATLGAGVNGAMSTGLTADILTLSKSEGLYGGVSLAGSVVSSDEDRDSSYYGQDFSARQIVIDQQGNNPGATPLKELLSRYGN